MAEKARSFSKGSGRIHLRRLGPDKLQAFYRRRPPLGPLGLIAIAFAAITSPWLVSHAHPTLVTGIPGVAGALLLIWGVRQLFARRASLRVDRREGSVEIRQGGGAHRVSLRDVVGVKVESIVTEESEEGCKVYRLDLLLQDGQRLALGDEFSAGYANKQRAAEELESFLRSA